MPKYVARFDVWAFVQDELGGSRNSQVVREDVVDYLHRFDSGDSAAIFQHLTIDPTGEDCLGAILVDIDLLCLKSPAALPTGPTDELRILESDRESRHGIGAEMFIESAEWVQRSQVIECPQQSRKCENAYDSK